MSKADNFETEMEKINDKDVSEIMKSPVFVGVNDIEGLEEVSAASVPLPFCRLVQPTSTKIALSNGKDATTGNFYFNDTLSQEEELHVCILKAKHSEMTFEGNDYPTKKLGILAVDMNNLQKVFILSLSVMSYGSFGSLIARIRAAEQTKTTLKEARGKVRDYVIKIISEKQENEKGKFYIAKFEIVEKVADEHKEQINQMYEKYLSSLDRTIVEE